MYVQDIFVEFQREPLKFHEKYRTYILKYTIVDDLRAVRLKSS